MKYFFVLGNNPALSAAEITAVFGAEGKIKLLPGGLLLLENPATDTKKLISRLGGTIKIGTISAEANRHRNEEVKEKILKMIETDLAEKGANGKYCFGFSYYGRSGLPVFQIGLEIKKVLKQKGLSCRLVTSREKTLSSVVVEQNNLTTRGIEIVLIEEAETIYIGKTEAVQAFKELSFRDFGRPERDDASGMIPPKLAQMMLNLSQKSPLLTKEGTKEVLLDPFCGSGTILMEAALMGIKNIIGSDISEKAVDDTKKNTEWLKKNFQSFPRPELGTKAIFNLQLFNISATEISQKIKPLSVDAIVTEPYLGPQRGGHNIQKTIQQLESLYADSLKEFTKILKPGGRVVMIWPVFTGRGAHQWDFLNPDISGWQIINPLPENLRQKLLATRRGTIVYGRSGQKVYREIVILKKT
jgi:tRNA G10  N-methylase Trm11